MDENFFFFNSEMIEILEKTNLTYGVYCALKSDDCADAVMTALPIVNNITIRFKKRVKCEHESNVFRLKGNEAIRCLMYKDALPYYNMAQLVAPTNSESMILALSNRSELLLQVRAKDACLKDIERCQAMKCSAEIIRRLETRKMKCAVMNTNTYNTREYAFAREYFKFDVKRNKDIPCASEDVDIVIENGISKIIAAKDIEPGKVVAIESAFVADLAMENFFTTCHYCHKASLNLLPCDGCCSVLFCDEDCKIQCFKEYHKIECQIIDCIDNRPLKSHCNLCVVATLKIREMSDSWTDFISYSLNVDNGAVREISKSDIYDYANIKSIINFNYDKYFIHGKAFNSCFYFAHIIKLLSNIRNYLPEDDKMKTEAQRALARVMLSLCMKFPCVLDIVNCTRTVSMGQIEIVRKPNYGLFSFTSKLTHSCTPNLYCAGLGNKLALIALKSIKKGSELTISIIGHWCETFYPGTKSLKLFLMKELRCQCVACIENWNPAEVEKPGTLSSKQKKIYHKILITLPRALPYSGEQFRETCRALKVFQDVGNTREFKAIFRDFIVRLSLFQCVSTLNVLI